ncbi:MAG: DNA polymerase III subunit gamma/tau [Cyanobacteriota bacterium]|nr:DNA polymerase III subunit gamma/tau [Cyanobacteriota bacterium]
MNPAYQPLHHKYRPQRLDQLVGQEAIATTLGHALRTGRIAPAYLFSGPRGTGKTSSARILARSLNCVGADGPTPEPCGSCELCTAISAGTALDVIEIDAASNTGVDNIRELIERSRFAPVQARWKVYVVDECHMLSTAAFNALLKTLEEPPPRVVFVLATTDPQRVLPTILSRCQRFDFRRIPLEALERHLAWIAGQEEIGITPEALHVVAQRSQGGLRDAESLLDQLSLLPAPIEASAVWELLGVVPEQELLELTEAMAGGEPVAVVEGVGALLERGRDPAAVLQGLAGLLRDLLLAGTAPDRLELTAVSPSLRPRLPEVARGIGKARLLQWQAQLRGSEQQLRMSVQPRLWLEVLILGLLAEPVGSPPATTGTPPAARPAAPPAARAAPAAAPAPVGAGASVPQPTGAPAATATEPQPQPQPQPPSQAAAAAPAQPAPAAVPTDLAEIWQRILARLELPSTRMLLSQQARLVRLDDHQARIEVAATWMAMVQSRLPLLERSVEVALGTPRTLTLVAGSGAAAEAQASAPAAAAPPMATAAAAGPPATAMPPAESAPEPAREPTPPARAAAPPPLADTAGEPPGSTDRGRPAPQATTAQATGSASVAATAPPAPHPRAAEPQTPSSGSTAAPAADGPAAPGGPAAAATAPGAPPAAAPPAARPPLPGSNAVEDSARRLADFFNGELIPDAPDDGD